MSLQLYIQLILSCLLVGCVNGNDDSAFLTTFNGSYYIFYQQPKTFPAALRSCRSMNGIIAPARTPQEGTFLRMLSQKYVGGRIWIGGTDVNRRDGDYIWLDGSPLVYKNWSPGEPLNAGGKENCMVMERGYSARWNDIDCNLFKHEYFCTVKRDPLRWTTLHQTFEYRYFNISRTLAKAEKVCIKHGGTLVIGRISRKKILLLNSIRSVFYNVPVWDDNVPSIWLNKSNGENCFIYSGNNTVVRRSCTSQHEFICVRNSLPSIFTTTTTVPVSTEIDYDTTESIDDANAKILEMGAGVNDRFEQGIGIGIVIGVVIMAVTCSVIIILFARMRGNGKISNKSSQHYTQPPDNPPQDPVPSGDASNYDSLQQRAQDPPPEYAAIKLYENMKS